MMTPKEYAELLEYINENHSWQHMYTNVKAGRKCIKYIDTCTDTRDGVIWIVKISFRDINNTPLPNDKKYDQIVFKEERCTVEEIKKWLNNNEDVEEPVKKITPNRFNDLLIYIKNKSMEYDNDSIVSVTSICDPKNDEIYEIRITYKTGEYIAMTKDGFGTEEVQTQLFHYDNIDNIKEWLNKRFNWKE